MNKWKQGGKTKTQKFQPKTSNVTPAKYIPGIYESSTPKHIAESLWANIKTMRLYLSDKEPFDEIFMCVVRELMYIKTETQQEFTQCIRQDDGSFF